MSTYRVFLLLYIQDGPVLESPLDHVGFGRCTLDMLTLLELAPEAVEVLELDEMPHLGERGGDDGGFAD